MEGCLTWQRDGLGLPKPVREATAGYRAAMDVLGDFIEDRCRVARDARASARDLFAAYTQWCEETRERPMTQKAFGLALGERGFDKRRSGKERWWFGIGLVTHVTDRDPRSGMKEGDSPREGETKNSGHNASHASQPEYEEGAV